MPYSRLHAIEFWYAFDNRTNPGYGQVARPVLRAYGALGGIDFPLERFREHRAAGTWPAGFVNEMRGLVDPLRLLSQLQTDAIAEFFAEDQDSIRLAFEDFGQGVLFDDRRPVGDKVHKMDGGGPTNPPIGYHRWYAILRAAVVSGGGDPARWLLLARNIGLAWAIQSEAKPEDDRPDNPELPVARLEELRRFWQALTFDELDSEFDKDPYP